MKKLVTGSIIGTHSKYLLIDIKKTQLGIPLKEVPLIIEELKLDPDTATVQQLIGLPITVYVDNIESNKLASYCKSQEYKYAKKLAVAQEEKQILTAQVSGNNKKAFYDISIKEITCPRIEKQDTSMVSILLPRKSTVKENLQIGDSVHVVIESHEHFEHAGKDQYVFRASNKLVVLKEMEITEEDKENKIFWGIVSRSSPHIVTSSLEIDGGKKIIVPDDEISWSTSDTIDFSKIMKLKLMYNEMGEPFASIKRATGDDPISKIQVGQPITALPKSAQIHKTKIKFQTDDKIECWMQISNFSHWGANRAPLKKLYQIINANLDNLTVKAVNHAQRTIEVTRIENIENWVKNNPYKVLDFDVIDYNEEFKFFVLELNLEKNGIPVQDHSSVILTMSRFETFEKLDSFFNECMQSKKVKACISDIKNYRASHRLTRREELIKPLMAAFSKYMDKKIIIYGKVVREIPELFSSIEVQVALTSNISIYLQAAAKGGASKLKPESMAKIHIKSFNPETLQIRCEIIKEQID